MISFTGMLNIYFIILSALFRLYLNKHIFIQPWLFMLNPLKVCSRHFIALMLSHNRDVIFVQAFLLT